MATATAASQARHKRVHRLRVSATSSIADALVLKDGPLFFLCQPDGQIAAGGDHGLGLYYHDCRFLDGYAFHIGEVPADLLASGAKAGFTASIELTNADIVEQEGVTEREQLGIHWERTVDGDGLVLEDCVEIDNFGVTDAHIPITLDFSASFESIFTIRGMAPG